MDSLMVSTKKKTLRLGYFNCRNIFLTVLETGSAWLDMSMASSWPEYGGHFILVIPLCASVSQPPLIETPTVSDLGPTLMLFDGLHWFFGSLPPHSIMFSDTKH